MNQMSEDDHSGHYPIVGRPDLDLSKYLVEVHGRKVIDYERLKNDDPSLYERLLADEHEANRLNQIEIDKLLSD